MPYETLQWNLSAVDLNPGGEEVIYNLENMYPFCFSCVIIASAIVLFDADRYTRGGALYNLLGKWLGEASWLNYVNIAYPNLT